MWFKIEETFYGGKGDVTFIKGYIDVESDEQVFDYLCRDVYLDNINDITYSGYSQEEKDENLRYENERRDEIIEYRDTGDYLGDETYYGVSTYLWEPVELSDTEMSAIKTLGLEIIAE